MTYPAQPSYGQPQYQPQAPAPQQYQPQAPAQYQPPAPQQQAPQQYAQAPQQQAPAFQPQPLPTFRAAANPSESPRQADFRGRLVLIMAKEIGTSQSRLTPGQVSQYVSCDVIVLDGGPVASSDPAQPGRLYDGHEFKGVWLSGVRVFGQLRGAVGTGEYILGRINTQKGHGDAAKGNAWGIETEFTPQDAELATRYLNGDRSFVVMPGTVPQGPVNPIAQSQAQFQQGVQQYNTAHAGQYNAPPQQQYAPAPQQAPQQGYPQYQPPQQEQAPQQPNPWAQNGQPLHQGGNPFAQQQ